MRRLAALLFLVVSGCGSIGSVQAHSISLAYKAGDTYKYTLHAVLDYTIGAEGVSVPFNLDLMGKGSIHVTTKSKYLRDEQVKNVNTSVVQSNIATTIDITIDMSAMGGQGGTPLFPSTGGASGVQGLSMKGTTTSDVTSWIDSG